MKAKKENSELNQFLQVTAAFLQSDAKDTKLGSLMKKQAKRVAKEVEKYEEEMEDLRIDACSVDEKNNILRDAKNNYIFSKEALKTLNKKAKELAKKEVEFDIYITVESLTNCPETYKDYLFEFAGIDIEVETEQ